MRAAVLLLGLAGRLCDGGARRPDVLFLVSDDMRPELGCYGCKYMHTPSIDALAHESIVFDSMHVQFALCSPSRTVFLTSRRPDTSMVHDQDFFRYSGGRLLCPSCTKQRLNFSCQCLIRFECSLLVAWTGNFTTLPQYFKNAGYLTLGTGKIYHPVPCQYITPLGIPCGTPESPNLDPAVAFDANFSWSPESLPYQVRRRKWLSQTGSANAIQTLTNKLVS